MTEAEKGSDQPVVGLSMTRTGEEPKGSFDDWVTQRMCSLERRLSESNNYLMAFVLDPIQILANEGLLEGASEVSIHLEQGSFAKYAWAHALYQRDPVGTMQAAVGNGVSKKLTLRVEGAICITIFGRRFCIRINHHF